MKGVILAGGTGSRLYPITKVINKHLLPIYHQPMIFYSIQTLRQAGIIDILIILGGESIGDFVRLLGSGEELGVTITYRCQDQPGGIAQALALAKDFVGSENVLVILGDNLIEDNLADAVQDFEKSDAKAGIFIKEVTDPERFGVVEIKKGQIVRIQEKPKKPKSNYAATGIYLYDPEVFLIIQQMEPSQRGEMEITDVNNTFIKQKALKAYFLDGFWVDAGKFESLYQASTLIRGMYLEGEEDSGYETDTWCESQEIESDS